MKAIYLPVSVCVFICVSVLAGCATPDFGARSAPEETAIKLPESGPYNPGPVVLLLDGKSGPVCEFEVQALYPIDIEPHSVEMQMTYTDTVTGASSQLFGGIQQLPLVDVSWTKMTPEGVMTSLTNWPAEGPCEQSALSVEIIKCWQGTCPRYVAGTSRIPMQLTIEPY